MHRLQATDVELFSKRKPFCGFLFGFSGGFIEKTLDNGRELYYNTLV